MRLLNYGDFDFQRSDYSGFNDSLGDICLGIRQNIGDVKQSVPNKLGNPWNLPFRVLSFRILLEEEESMIDNTMNPFLIFISACLINNILLIKFLGLCSFFGLSSSIKNSVGMSLAVIFVTIMATVVSWIIFHLVLVPLNLVFLRTATFILTIATLVQIEEMFIKKYLPPLYKAMGI